MRQFVSSLNWPLRSPELLCADLAAVLLVSPESSNDDLVGVVRVYDKKKALLPGYSGYLALLRLSHRKIRL